MIRMFVSLILLGFVRMICFQIPVMTLVHASKGMMIFWNLISSMTPIMLNMLENMNTNLLKNFLSW